MNCRKCKKEFDENLGWVCPYCLTAYIIRDGGIIDIILTKKCPMCGSRFHLQYLNRKVQKRIVQIPKAVCLACGKNGAV